MVYQIEEHSLIEQGKLHPVFIPGVDCEWVTPGAGKGCLFVVERNPELTTEGFRIASRCLGFVPDVAGMILAVIRQESASIFRHHHDLSYHLQPVAVGTDQPRLIEGYNFWDSAVVRVEGEGVYVSGTPSRYFANVDLDALLSDIGPAIVRDSRESDSLFVFPATADGTDLR